MGRAVAFSPAFAALLLALGGPARAESVADLRGAFRCLVDDLEVKSDAQRCPPLDLGAAPRPPRRPTGASVRRTDGKRPKWVDRRPAQAGKLFGVGSGKDLLSAQREALEVIANQISVRLEIHTTDEQSTARVRRNDAVSVVERQTIRTRSRYIIQRTLDEAELADDFRDDEGVVHALVSFDVASIPKREEAVVAAALETMMRGLQKLRQALEEGAAVPARTLRTLVEVLGEIRVLEESHQGSDLPLRWAEEKARFRTLVQSMVDSLHIQIDGGGHLLGTIEVGHRRPEPIAGLEMDLHAVRGYVENLPERARLDARGRTELGLGPVYGSDGAALQVRFRIAPRRAMRNADLRSRHQVLKLRSEARLIYDFRFTGPLEPSVHRELVSLLERQLGARENDGEAIAAEVTAEVVYVVEEAIPRDGQVMLTVRLSVSWQGPTSLPRRSWVGAGTGKNEATAEKRAVADLERRLRTDRGRR